MNELRKKAPELLWTVAGVVVVFVGSMVLDVPWIYLQILLADLIILTGVLIAVVASHRLLHNEWPDFDKLDWDGFIVSGVVLLYTIALAYVSYKGYNPGNWRAILRLAISVGALGGLIHEISQSGGKFAIPQWVGATNQSKGGKKNPPEKATVTHAAPAEQVPDGVGDPPASSTNSATSTNSTTTQNLYLGSLTGVLFGALAGVLVMQSLTPPQNPMTFATQVFLAGLALKGVSEALADTQAKQPTGHQSNNAG